jgi:hypothetical protein
MTPAELNALVEACDEREKAVWFREAWFAAIMLSPHLKRGRKLDPMKLLPSWLQERKGPRTKEEARQELDDLKKELKVE